MATNKTNTAETRRLVEDLTDKYPRGPRRLLNRNHYTTSSEWSDHYRTYKPTVKLRPELAGYLGMTELAAQHWGYEPLQLFKLGVRGEESARDLVKSLYSDVKGATLTRRARLLWARLKPAVSHIMKNGAEGIWSVTSYHAPYGSLWRDMKIWGACKTDVEAQVRLIGPMTGLKPDWPLDIKFHDLGSPDEATQHAVRHANMRVSRIKSDIEVRRREIERLEKELEEEMKLAAQSMGGIMLLSGTGDEEQEEAQ